MRRMLAGLAAVLVAVAGYATADVYDRVPGVLTLAAAPQHAGMPSAPLRGPAAAGAPRALQAGAAAPVPSVSPSAAQVPSVPVPSVPASAAGSTAALALPDAGADVPTRAGLTKALKVAIHDPGLGSSVGLTVRDARSGRHLIDVDASRPRTPASTTKLLTAAAITSTLDPRSRMTTRVVRGATTHDIVLVAGGDTLLAPGRGEPDAVAGRAGLADLAVQVATALHRDGVDRVRLGVDVRHAAGPRYAPGWAGADIAAGYTGPVAMLGLSTQRPTPGHPASRDPAGSAAQALARGLRSRGISVAAPVGVTRAPAGATALGSVSSAPVGEILALALDDSDNALTESLARQAASRAGVATDFASVARWVAATVAGLGIDTSGVHLVDSCGLSSGTKVPTRVIGDVLALAASGRAPVLQDVVAELPVAGLSGTLHDRFLRAPSHLAAGVARAKTGTLTGVSALAGTVVDRDGRLLLYAVLADDVPPGAGTLSARAALDRLVATLSACGCR